MTGHQPEPETVHYFQQCDTCDGIEKHDLLEIVSGIARCLSCGSINDVDNDAIPESVWTDYESKRRRKRPVT